MQKELLWLEVAVMSIVIWQWYEGTFKAQWGGERTKPKRKWTLRARTPEDCQDCRLAGAEARPGRSQARRQWAEVKSARGRPKEHDGNGRACMNSGCEYYRDTDAEYHALRWDGARNKCEVTDQWECGACGKKRTARFGTPLYRLKTSSERVALATHLAMKGMSLADISEVLGHSPRRWRGGWRGKGSTVSGCTSRCSRTWWWGISNWMSW